MKTMKTWLEEYGASHQHPVNKMVHWICVPVIFFTVVALLWTLPVPQVLSLVPYGNWATVGLALAILYYLRLSWRMALGMAVYAVLNVGLVLLWEQHGPVPLWQMAVMLFVAAWAGQFVGHQIEGKKPSFFKDLQFLLIGPAWLMVFIYRRLGIRIE